MKVGVVMWVLWAGGSEGVDFHGDFHSLTGACPFPNPFRDNRITLLIGGRSAAAARRADRIGAGFRQHGLGGDELTGASPRLGRSAPWIPGQT